MGRRQKKLQYRKILYVLFFLVFVVFIIQFFAEGKSIYIIEDAVHFEDNLSFELLAFEHGDFIDDKYQHSVLRGNAQNMKDYDVSCKLIFNLKNEDNLIKSFEDSINIFSGEKEEFEMDIELFIGKSENDFIFDCFRID